MKFAITGATGFVGRKLVASLLRNQHEVRVLTRDPLKAKHLFGNAVECALWNPEQGSGDSSIIEGTDAVIHLAGEGIADKRWSPEQKKRIHDSRVLGTRDIITLLKQAKGPAPQTFVCASAIGLYGDRGEEELSEYSPAGQGYLSDVCADWESEASAAPDQIRTVQLRIGIVLGTEGGALKKMLPIFKLGAGGPIGHGQQWMSWIHVEDLVRLIIEAATNPKYESAVNAVAPNPVRNADFGRQLGEALNRPAFMPAPAMAIKLAMGELSVLVLSSQKVLPKVAMANGFQFKFPQLREALEDLVKKKRRELECFQWIAKPKEEVFPFFSNEKNLERITPGWLGFQVIGKSHPAITQDCRIDYKLKLHGVPLRWQSQILEWQPSQHFVDTQVTGPYRYWHHTHDFHSFKGGTLIRDFVVYELPEVPLFQGLAQRFVEKDLSRIFEFRREQIEKHFSSK